MSVQGCPEEASLRVLCAIAADSTGLLLNLICWLCCRTPATCLSNGVLATTRLTGVAGLAQSTEWAAPDSQDVMTFSNLTKAAITASTYNGAHHPLRSPNALVTCEHASLGILAVLSRGLFAFKYAHEGLHQGKAICTPDDMLQSLCRGQLGVSGPASGTAAACLH